MPTKNTTPSARTESLSAGEVLAGEFNYIANSAFQANEDRSKAASFFIVSVGSLVAAMFGAQQLSKVEEIPVTLYLVLAFLFFGLTFLGGLTIAQLARLRAAWHESAQAMDQIKTYLIEKFPDLELKKAFRWRAETLPPLYKTNSISYYTAIEVALLSGCTFGTGVFFFQYGIQRISFLWPFSIGFGIFALAAQLFLYKKLLLSAK